MLQRKFLNILTFLITFIMLVNCVPDPGKTETKVSMANQVARQERPLLADTSINVKITCDSTDKINVTIYWKLVENLCWLEGLYEDNVHLSQLMLNNTLHVYESEKIQAECHNSVIILPELVTDVAKNEKIAQAAASAEAKTAQKTKRAIADKHNYRQPSRIILIPTDGIYDLTITVLPIKEDSSFDAIVYVEFYGPHGYISANDWPLLPFYGVMCAVYVIFGIIWLVVSFMQWRDLLRIQFWIGGVILLGMLEKAFFYEQYHSLTKTGLPVQGAELVAEFVSCAKRTLARMLVIIMSLGFGIVKPRLGPMLHRVVGVGALYFILACVESFLRIMRTKTDERSQLLVASIPLAVLDTVICWWIFTSLVQTTRTLRLRRNMVKLSLYRHFTNTLIFSVFASVIFMLYAMRLRRTENCTPGWKQIWVDTAFWHILFSVLLLVIMILWRPTNNNQRYAFTPLLDNPEDEDDDEEDQFVADAYGVKMRGTNVNGTRTPPTSQRATTTEEDDLRWVEENIPSSIADPALPILDSDEEILNTKFEVSKMQ